MRKYKIGLLSKLYGITPQTLRFYEKEGLLLPIPDDVEGSTRMYSIFHFNWLHSVRTYLSMGFTTKEIRQLFQCKSHQELNAAFSKKSTAILDKIQQLVAQEQALLRQQEKFSLIDKLLGKIQCERSPEIWFLLNQPSHDAVECDVSEQVAEWMNYLPSLQSASLISAQLLRDEVSSLPRVYGFAIEAQEGKRLGIPFSKDVKVFPSQQCIHTVVVMTEENDHLTYHFLRSTIDDIRRQGYTVTGDAVGFCIAKIDEEHCKTDSKPKAVYHELWIPVETPVLNNKTM